MKLRYFLASLTLLLSINVVSVHAQSVPLGTVVEPTPAAPTLTASPVIITAAATSTAGPQFVQLYNNSDNIQDIRGWKVLFTANDTANEYQLELATYDRWIQPRGYVVVAAEGVVTGADITYTLPMDAATQLSTLPTRTYRLEAPTEQSIAPATMINTVTVPQWQERNKSTTTGKYLDTYTTKTTFASLVGGGLYVPPDDVGGLRIVEILSNARSCSPTETALDCGDYVKLHNASAVPVYLNEYRLRTDSGGTKSSATNTVKLTGILEPDSYIAIRLRDSGDKLSITNDGGYVWLEDAYGVKVYAPIISYPDTTSKQGQSWALDAQDNTWKYMTPVPEAANYWPPPEPVVLSVTVTTTSSELEDCGPGRERNPETNRCRTIATASATALAPCPAGQERNPETNRCRSIVVAATALKACGPGEERNPETNRCRSILTAASTTKLAPCPVGQERNPETNRCRKIATTPVANIASVTDVESVENIASTQWYIAAGAVALALAYALYEWRVDIVRKLKTIRGK